MPIFIENRSGVDVPEIGIESLLEFAFGALALNSESELSLTFVDNSEMSDLHLKWMDEPGPTDVLSFPMDLPDGDEAVTLGDIVIAPVFAAEQARVAGHEVAHEISILAVHGLLHILGYDHAVEEEERVMFELQEKLVSDWEKVQ